MNRYQGPLKNPLSLALPDGTAFRLTEAEVCLSVHSGVDALSVAARVAVDWLDRAFATRATPILLVGHSVTLASAALRSWELSRVAGDVTAHLDLLLKDGDGPALLRHLSEPVRPLPLSADELAALAAATRDDDPAGLIPRLLATVAAKRGERLEAGVVRIVAPGERVIAGQAVAVTGDSSVVPVKVPGVFWAWGPGGGAGGVTRPRGATG